VTLLDKLKVNDEREWYALRSTEHGWSRNVLAMQIGTRLHERQGSAVTNFPDRLPPLRSDLARETLKDPYIFDFLGLTEDAQERDIERALTQHITRFLLELGAGFAFVARQYRLEVGGDEFFIDLLFYHLKLRCYVVVELKATPFRPEYAGQLNFYLSAVDAQVKNADDEPTIGLLLCRENNRLVAEYALRGRERSLRCLNTGPVQPCSGPFNAVLLAVIKTGRVGRKCSNRSMLPLHPRPAGRHRGIDGRAATNGARCPLPAAIAR
jgi:predicted nuclease of restriction endonuclease-like (RecB) superfamily